MAAAASTAVVDAAIVDVLAVLIEPMPRSTINRAISAGRLCTVTLDVVHDRLRALTASGVLIATGEAWALPPAERHRVMQQLASAGRVDRVADGAVVARPPKVSHSSRVPSWWDSVRLAQAALYAGRWDDARANLAQAQTPWPTLVEGAPPEWVDGLRADLVASASAQVMHQDTVLMRPCAAWVARLAALPPASLTDDQHSYLVWRLILEGRHADADRLLANRSSVQAAGARATLQLFGGDAAGALAAFERALTAFYKEFGKRAKFFPDRTGVCFVIAALAAGKLDRALALCDLGETDGVSAVRAAYPWLRWVASVFKGAQPSPPSRLVDANAEPVEVLCCALAHRWNGRTPSGLDPWVARADTAGLDWVAGQLERCLAGAGRPVVGADLSTLVSRPDRVSEALTKLEALATGAAPSAAEPSHQLRLVWVVPASKFAFQVEPREQVYSKGGWSKGRAVALKRLYDESAKMSHLTPVDRAVCGMITEVVSTGRYRDVSYDLDGDDAITALVEAPNLFAELADGSLAPAQVRVVAPRLTATQRAGSVDLALKPAPSEGRRPVVTRVGPTSFQVTRFETVHLEIASILGPKGLTVPEASAPRMRAALAALGARVVVDADLGDAVTITADATPRFEVRRREDGLVIEAIARPAGDGGPRARVGGGAKEVSAHVDGRRVQAVRDLAAESAALRAICARCPTLVGEGPWALLDRDAAFSALSELVDASAKLDWGHEAPVVLAPLDVADLTVRLAADGDGFALSGSLGGTDLPTLWAYLEASPSRFLGEASSLVVLTAALRERLDALRRLSAPGGRLRYHPLRAHVVDELIEGARVEGDVGWRAAVARLTTPGRDPEVPATLQASLRPYQVDGFRWLARLARWGVGGCLADDMGVGKTVQVLALLLHRAADGPSIVVAPTSVLSVWTDEISRFAPSLRARVYTGARRASMLENLGPSDVVLTSYAILQLDAEALAAVAFTVAVLDEAQAIKNPETARARAALALRADQRVATTGTPIENRLSDLWSLVRFLNPGLLGSAKEFDERFGRPIERDRSAAARDQLRRLVGPFLLRRTKAQVLADLPARTEVVWSVELGEHEIATYDAVRADILDEFNDASTPARRRFALLAGITRLRRAASHARMVLPESPASSTKLDALAEILDDVVPSGHKALVFSQFVDHLALARDALQGSGYVCRYLDGSTRAAARKAEVDAFQRGDGDVFLISLKAGGVGLNLTAADYVIHLDPWWNPAAEDQASDRSHRLGQTRPVTVYRLVARDTIEDQIVSLHRRKRELAVGLLEGAAAAGALSEHDLLDLIRGGASPGR